MRRRDRIAHYGQIGLMFAAFALVTGIVAAPLLEGGWSPVMTIAAR
jgi:hypothetical protein